MSQDIIKQTPAEMIMAAVTANTDLDKLKGLMELQFKWEANEARKAYARDFSTAQANILPVVKSKFNKQTQSNYADLSDIIETTQPIYTKEGFSVTFNEGDCPKEGHARILADVLHCLGHNQQYHLDVPLDGAGIKGNANMTPIHGKASAVAYGKKYLMCMIWNIPTSDDDGNKASSISFITDKQLSQLRDILASKEVSPANIIKLMGYLSVTSLEELPSTAFMTALAAINAIPSGKKGV